MTVGGLDEIDPTKEHKVLGSNWNLAEDTFVLKLNKVVEFARDLGRLDSLMLDCMIQQIFTPTSPQIFGICERLCIYRLLC